MATTVASLLRTSCRKSRQLGYATDSQYYGIGDFSDQRSPMTYDADMPQAVLDEDLLIDNIPIGFDSVEVVPAEEVFD